MAGANPPHAAGALLLQQRKQQLAQGRNRGDQIFRRRAAQGLCCCRAIGNCAGSHAGMMAAADIMDAVADEQAFCRRQSEQLHGATCRRSIRFMLCGHLAVDHGVEQRRNAGLLQRFRCAALALEVQTASFAPCRRNSRSISGTPANGWMQRGCA